MNYFFPKVTRIDSAFLSFKSVVERVGPGESSPAISHLRRAHEHSRKSAAAVWAGGHTPGPGWSLWSWALPAGISLLCQLDRNRPAFCLRTTSKHTFFQIKPTTSYLHLACILARCDWTLNAISQAIAGCQPAKQWHFRENTNAVGVTDCLCTIIAVILSGL